MKPSVELKEIMLHFYEHESVSHLCSHQDGVLFIGTDPGERWAGFDLIEAMLKAQEPTKGARIKIKPGELHAYVEGTVGWMDDTPTFQLADGREFRARATSVFHKEGGEWRMVQHHVSVGIPNAEVLARGRA